MSVMLHFYVIGWVLKCILHMTGWIAEWRRWTLKLQRNIC